MKKIKTLFILALCFTILATSTPVAPDYDVNPCGHYGIDDDRL